MGAGRSGLFYSTEGAKRLPPILERKNLRYDKRKTEGYLLNLNHVKGGAKAKFFQEVLGYSQNNAEQFHDAIFRAVKGKMPTKTEITHYGIKYTFHTTLKGANGCFREANVVVVVQKDNGRITCKIVTVYPLK